MWCREMFIFGFECGKGLVDAVQQQRLSHVHIISENNIFVNFQSPEHANESDTNMQDNSGKLVCLNRVCFCSVPKS